MYDEDDAREDKQQNGPRNSATDSKAADLKAIELKEQLAAWWAAYLAIYAALQLDETMSDTQRERTAVERADLAMRVWQNKQRMLLNAEPETTLAEQIYLREKKRSEEEAAKTPKPSVLPIPISYYPPAEAEKSEQ